jgi:hypothetical protein
MTTFFREAIDEGYFYRKFYNTVNGGALTVGDNSFINSLVKI